MSANSSKFVMSTGNFGGSGGQTRACLNQSSVNGLSRRESLCHLAEHNQALLPFRLHRHFAKCVTGFQRHLVSVNRFGQSSRLIDGTEKEFFAGGAELCKDVQQIDVRRVRNVIREHLQLLVCRFDAGVLNRINWLVQNVGENAQVFVSQCRDLQTLKILLIIKQNLQLLPHTQTQIGQRVQQFAKRDSFG